MKIRARLGLILAGLSICGSASAQEPAKAVEPVPIKADAVSAKGGKVMFLEEGKLVTLETNGIFAGSILVTTNATFKLQNGKERKLKEGDTLNKDLTLTGADGSITPVEDHVAFKGGRVTVIIDGEPSIAGDVVTLKDGTTIQPEGVINRHGKVTRLIDGVLIKIDGTIIQATDTATLKEGQVVIQKDGALIRINPAQSFTMSDGTRVFGNGTVKKPDGSEVQLQEGQILRIEGVRTGLQ